MLSAFDEHTKQSTIERWNEEEVLFTRDAYVKGRTDYIARQVDAFLKKFEQKPLTQAQREAITKELNAICTRYFYKNGNPKIDMIAERGIDVDANVDDCDPETVLDVITTIEFLEVASYFGAPLDTIGEVLPVDYDDFKYVR